MTHRKRSLGPLLAFALFLPVVATSQQTSKPAHSGQSLGTVRFENSGQAEAQEAFIRGLSALHSFFYDEAAELFRRAQAIDPNFAMAYWGEALTYNHPLWMQQEREEALAVLERLGESAEERLAKAPSEREKAYLRSLDVLFGEGDKLARDLAYADAMAKISRDYPEDEDALALYALSLQGTQRRGKWSDRIQIQSAALLERAFDQHPDHPGILHYLIHAYDDPLHAPLGLRAAELYARVAPAAHHALHMPSHIFLQLGMWDDVVRSNVAAYQASVDWTKKREMGRDKEDDHSLLWLHYAYLQTGQTELAEDCLATIDSIVEDSRTEYTAASQTLMHARHAMTMNLPLADDFTSSRSLIDASAAYARASYSLSQGDVDRGREQLEKIRSLEADDTPEVSRLARRLQALLHLSNGLREEGLQELGALAAEVHALDPPSGPPVPPKPLLELYAEKLMEDEQFEQAFQVFRDSLERTPGRTLSLIGAARAANAQGQLGIAADYYSRALEILRAASPDHPLYREASKFAKDNG